MKSSFHGSGTAILSAHIIMSHIISYMLYVIGFIPFASCVICYILYFIVYVSNQAKKHAQT